MRRNSSARLSPPARAAPLAPQLPKLPLPPPFEEGWKLQDGVAVTRALYDIMTLVRGRWGEMHTHACCTCRGWRAGADACLCVRVCAEGGLAEVARVGGVPVACCPDSLQTPPIPPAPAADDHDDERGQRVRAAGAALGLTIAWGEPGVSFPCFSNLIATHLNRPLFHKPSTAPFLALSLLLCCFSSPLSLNATASRSNSLFLHTCGMPAALYMMPACLACCQPGETNPNKSASAGGGKD